MSADNRPGPIGKWQRRLLLAVLPVGVVLLVVWVAWLAISLAGGLEAAVVSWPSAGFGLVTSLLLIGFGYSWRRALARLPHR